MGSASFTSYLTGWCQGPLSGMSSNYGLKHLQYIHANMAKNPLLVRRARSCDRIFKQHYVIYNSRKVSNNYGEV